MTYSLRGKAFWSKVYPELAQENKYSIDLSLLDDKAVKFCKQLGLKVKKATEEGDTRGEYISLWNYATNFDGTPKTLKVVDASLNTMKEAIGNGSMVHVEFKPKDWKYNNKKGIRAELLAVQVEELIPYGAGSTLKPIEGGYVSTGIQAVIEEDTPPFEMETFDGDVGQEAV